MRRWWQQAVVWACVARERRTYLASSTRICVDLCERVGFLCDPAACEPLEPALSGSPVLPRLAASAPEPLWLLL